MTQSAPQAVILATRRSQLALAQARAFAQRLIDAHFGLVVDELLVITTGDRIQDRPLSEVGGKGLFVKEIEEALLDRTADFAVHSIKDVPAELAQGLHLACIPKRVDPRDVIVSRSGARLQDLAPGSKVGTSSLRRAVFLRMARPDLQYVPLRGNVDTRLRKVRDGEVDVAVLAFAGLTRLGLSDVVTQPLEPELCLPAVGQGALGIECRSGDDRILKLLSALHDPQTAMTVRAERGVMLAVEGNCKVPVAAFAELQPDGQMRLRAMFSEPDGSRLRQSDEIFPWPSSESDAHDLGVDLGLRLKHKS